MSFPEAYDEELNYSVYAILNENAPPDDRLRRKFTGYYDGVMEETDSYLESPTTLTAALS